MYGRNKVTVVQYKPVYPAKGKVRILESPDDREFDCGQAEVEDWGPEEGSSSGVHICSCIFGRGTNMQLHI